MCQACVSQTVAKCEIFFQKKILIASMKTKKALIKKKISNKEKNV